MPGSSTTFLLSAADVSWGRRERTCVTVNAVATTLDAKYFELDSPASDFGASTDFYVWFDLDGASVDPAPGGTGIEVDIVTGDDAVAVALKMQVVLEAHASFRAKLDTDAATVIVDAEFKGPVTAATVDGDSGFVFVQAVSGAGEDLGKTSGGVEVAMESTAVQILADQTGGLVQDEVLTGQTIEVTTSLLEMTSSRWKSVVGSVTGDVYTPSGGSELVGFGESRLYSSLFDLGGELVLHPTRLAASDRSKNITLWKSAPKPASINFSGEEPQVMEVSFTALADREIVEAIRLMAFGDNEQDVRA